MKGLYIHIPFCVKKCFYCDFYSEELLSSSKREVSGGISDKSIDQFMASLLREIDLRCEAYDFKPEIDSIFFGGGTPSLLSTGKFEKIFNKIKMYFSISENAEITVECNPGTVTLEKLVGYKSIGINRISFGVQSFIEKELDFLQRIHTSHDTVRSINIARKAEFDNISIDLMFAVPNQTEKSIKYNLDQALSLEIDHISAYSLIYENGTPLFDEFVKGKIKKISDEADAEQYDLVMQTLKMNGFEHYEVSNYALNGKKCLHNLNYWNGGEYFAFGPSAHGYLDGIRYWNVRNNIHYNNLIAKGEIPTEGFETLTHQDKIVESILLGLRSEGIKIDLLSTQYPELNIFINEIISDKLCIMVKDKLRLTDKGYHICDEIALRILKIIETKNLDV